jgi:hypothetical protein
LTTRHVLGVEWSVDVGIIFHRERHPKTIPILVRKLRKMILRAPIAPEHKKPPASIRAVDATRREMDRSASFL